MALELRLAFDAALEAAREAGRLLRDDFHRPGGPRGGGHHADVDSEAETRIREIVLARCPWSFLGEETGRHRRRDCPQVWIVDPNDGTVSYLKGMRGSAVSIALLSEGRLRLGVVYAFAYPDDDGDLIAWAEDCGPIVRNGKPVACRLTDPPSSNPPPAVLVSQDADRSPRANALCVKPYRYIAMPSVAYRMALVAAGEGIATVSLSGPQSWDIAAGQALIEAAGGVVRAFGFPGKLQPIVYEDDGEAAPRNILAGSSEAVELLSRRDWNKVLGAERTKAKPPYTLARLSRGHAIGDPGRLARAQGCLLGQLAGDALGGLVEFQSAVDIRRSYPDGVRNLCDGGTWHNLAGQPTDDSEMALILARSIVAEGRYDPGAALDAYVHWYRSEPFDIGSTTSLALSAARGSTREERCAAAAERANRQSQANGSLMRISPLAVYGAGRIEEAVVAARLDSGLTHPHPVCRESCAVFVAAIAATIAKGLDAEGCYRAALEQARRSNAPTAVRMAIEESRDKPPADYQSQMGWVLIALQNAFYQLLHAPNLEEGVVDTVMRGGDTDTNAAIAGALLGAVHGRPAVPDRWRRALLACRPLEAAAARHPRPPEFWPVDAQELAERLLLAGLGGNT